VAVALRMLVHETAALHFPANVSWTPN
jgi:hypothetical protein